MAKTLTCPECKAALDPRGIKFHRAAKHGVPMKNAGAPAKAVPTASGDSLSAAARPPPKETLAMGSPKGAPAAPPPPPPPPRKLSPFESLANIFAGPRG